MNKVIEKVSEIVIRIRNNGTRKSAEQKIYNAIKENDECTQEIVKLINGNCKGGNMKKMLVVIAVMVWSLVMAGAANAQEKVNSWLHLDWALSVPLIEFGNIAKEEQDDGSNDLVIHVNSGEMGAGIKFLYRPKEGKVKALDWDLGIFSYLGQRDGEDFSFSLGIVFSTLKIKGVDGLHFGGKYRFSGDGNTNHRLTFLLGIGVL